MLKQRVITAVAAALALLVVLFVLPQPAARLVIAAILLVAAWEWSGLIGAQSALTRGLYVVLMAGGLLAAWRYATGPAAALRNGLSDAENRELFACTEARRIADLVLTGLVNLACPQA